jgi:hypothetical protein
MNNSEELQRELQRQAASLTRQAAVAAFDIEDLPRLRALADQWNPARIEAHLREVVSAAPLLTDPFPHLVIEPLLPDEAFRIVLDSVPPEEFFDGENHPDVKGLGLPTSILPLYSRIVWRSMREIIGGVLSPLLAERFRPVAADFLRLSVGEEFVNEVLSMPLYASGHRLMLRRPGWKLDPHLDPRSRFINTLLYLARPGEPEGYGTQLFRVHQEHFVARQANTYYPERDGIRCEVAKTMPYRGNLALSFLNLGGGAHGAAFPAVPETAGLRRVVFQFYMEPGFDDLNELISRLPADKQPAWTTRIKKKDLRAQKRAAEQ